MPPQQQQKVSVDLPGENKITLEFRVQDQKGRFKQPEAIISAAIGTAHAASGTLAGLCMYEFLCGRDDKFEDSYQLEAAFGPNKSMKLTGTLDVDLRGQYSQEDINDLALNYILRSALEAATGYTGNWKSIISKMSDPQSVVSRIDEVITHNHAVNAMAGFPSEELEVAAGRRARERQYA